MQDPIRFSALPDYAFPRLRRLIEGIEPGAAPVAMSIGEPQHAVPDFIGPELARHVATLSKYPPNEGIPELRAAIGDWLGLRYGIGPALRDPDHCILPLNGTREGLFNACLALSPERKDGRMPAVLMPNPFYQAYAVGALAAGAEPVYLPATAAMAHLPDFGALPADLLDRTTVVYLCSPTNPQGACADETYWRELLALAERHDFRVFADECYSEIWRETPPVGALEVLARTGGDPERLVVFNSLSKRSSLAGLRAGFCCTGPRSRALLLQLRSYAGAPLPIPIQHAAAAAWSDEEHVAASRALYQEKFRLADAILGPLPGYVPPQAGFFVWLGVGDGEAAALRLWREAGVLALPGAYLSRPAPDWLGGGDPGAAYLRLALVAPAREVERGLRAVADVLG